MFLRFSSLLANQHLFQIVCYSCLNPVATLQESKVEMIFSLIIYTEENSTHYSMGNLSKTERRKGANLRQLHSEGLI